jgi:uncharacterized membrane protein
MYPKAGSPAAPVLRPGWIELHGTSAGGADELWASLLPSLLRTTSLLTGQCRSARTMPRGLPSKQEVQPGYHECELDHEGEYPGR